MVIVVPPGWWQARGARRHPCARPPFPPPPFTVPILFLPPPSPSHNDECDPIQRPSPVEREERVALDVEEVARLGVRQLRGRLGQVRRGVEAQHAVQPRLDGVAGRVAVVFVLLCAFVSSFVSFLR